MFDYHTLVKLSRGFQGDQNSGVTWWVHSMSL